MEHFNHSKNSKSCTKLNQSRYNCSNGNGPRRYSVRKSTICTYYDQQKFISLFCFGKRTQNMYQRLREGFVKIGFQCAGSITLIWLAGQLTYFARVTKHFNFPIYTRSIEKSQDFLQSLLDSQLTTNKIMWSTYYPFFETGGSHYLMHINPLLRWLILG